MFPFHSQIFKSGLLFPSFIASSSSLSLSNWAHPGSRLSPVKPGTSKLVPRYRPLGEPAGCLQPSPPYVLRPRRGFSRRPGPEGPPVGLPQPSGESGSTPGSQTSGCRPSDRWATHAPTRLRLRILQRSPEMTLNLYTQITSKHFQMLALAS